VLTETNKIAVGKVVFKDETIICDIVEWLYRRGIRKVLLLIGHMWNLGPIYSARENIHYDFPDLQVRVLDWWATTPQIVDQSMKDCPVLPSYVHANIGETSCMLAVRPDLVNMASAIDEDDYKTFFEYGMDQYSKSGIVGRDATKATAKFGDKRLGMDVDNLASMVEHALRVEIARSLSNDKLIFMILVGVKRN